MKRAACCTNTDLEGRRRQEDGVARLPEDALRVLANGSLQAAVMSHNAHLAASSPTLTPPTDTLPKT
jgi:hypothetical protein